tara:strand:+ start:262 stop:444 length:183 start_codon:yes stop_codon:yes gene_type:complete
LLSGSRPDLSEKAGCRRKTCPVSTFSVRTALSQQTVHPGALAKKSIEIMGLIERVDIAGA